MLLDETLNNVSVFGWAIVSFHRTIPLCINYVLSDTGKWIGGGFDRTKNNTYLSVILVAEMVAYL
jgi:hypothetical protein